MDMPGRLRPSDDAMEAYTEVLASAILAAIDRGGADAAMEFLTTLTEVTGGDVDEYVAELTEGRADG